MDSNMTAGVLRGTVERESERGGERERVEKVVRRPDLAACTVHMRDPRLRLLERIPKMQNDIARRVTL